MYRHFLSKVLNNISIRRQQGVNALMSPVDGLKSALYRVRHSIYKRMKLNKLPDSAIKAPMGTFLLGNLICYKFSPLISALEAFQSGESTWLELVHYTRWRNDVENILSMNS